MSVMPDSWIIEQSLQNNMIAPFVNSKISDNVISYGISSYGYDARISDEFNIFTNVHSSIIDPKNFDNDAFIEKKGDFCIIPPNSFVLARTVEYFKIPRNVLVICLGKSTYARCGIIVNVTPLEPCWEGHVVLEFSNTTTLPSKIYANEGACQLVFLKADKDCSLSYKDSLGKYMYQKSITLPTVKKNKTNNHIEQQKIILSKNKNNEL